MTKLFATLALAHALCLPSLSVAGPQKAYLAELLEAEKVLAQLPKPESIKTEQEKIQFLTKFSGPLQMLGTHRAFSGDIDGAIAAFDLQRYEKPSARFRQGEEAESLDGTELMDAVKAIVEEAKNRRVVILNESHHVPMHRAFAMQLARELKKIGYSYLACETFEDQAPMSRGYAHEFTGYYSNEPVFAQFLRDAARSGWKFVAYEPFADNQTRLDREIGEAENLVKKVLDRDPASKVFVFVGYSHALKLPESKNTKDFAWMAAQLKRMTGLDPLSVDQTTMYAHHDAAAEHPLYRKTLARFDAKQAFVLAGGAGKFRVFGNYQGGMDMQVFHPAYGKAKFERADWLWSLAERRPVPVPANLLPQSGRRLLLAFHEEDGEDAVPVDAVLIKAHDVPKAFALPEGRFRYSFQAPSTK